MQVATDLTELFDLAQQGDTLSFTATHIDNRIRLEVNGTVSVSSYGIYGKKLYLRRLENEVKINNRPVRTNLTLEKLNHLEEARFVKLNEAEGVNVTGPKSRLRLESEEFVDGKEKLTYFTLSSSPARRALVIDRLELKHDGRVIFLVGGGALETEDADILKHQYLEKNRSTKVAQNVYESSPGIPLVVAQQIGSYLNIQPVVEDMAAERDGKVPKNGSGALPFVVSFSEKGYKNEEMIRVNDIVRHWEWEFGHKIQNPDYNPSIIAASANATIEYNNFLNGRSVVNFLTDEPTVLCVLLKQDLGFMLNVLESTAANKKNDVKTQWNYVHLIFKSRVWYDYEVRIDKHPESGIFFVTLHGSGGTLRIVEGKLILETSRFDNQPIEIMAVYAYLPGKASIPSLMHNLPVFVLGTNSTKFYQQLTDEGFFYEERYFDSRRVKRYTRRQKGSRKTPTVAFIELPLTVK